MVSKSFGVVEIFADKIEKNHYHGNFSSVDAGSRLHILPNGLRDYRHGICGNVENCLADYFPYFFPVCSACSANAKELADEFECEAIKECTDP